MASKTEALALVIDVSPSMVLSDENGETSLNKCLTAANMIVQRKIFTDTKKNKDEAALILFGTDESQNALNENFGEGSYENITVKKELGVMDLKLLNIINKEVTQGFNNGDFIDALVVALDHLNTKCRGRKMEQKIILFSSLHNEFSEDALNNIINGMKGNNVTLIFVGPEIDDDDEDEDDEEHDKEKNNEEGSRNQPDVKPLTEQQMRGVKCVNHILQEVDGDGVSMNEILPMLSFFETRRKKQVTTFRGPIEIGSNLKINVYSYVKVKEERPASWKKLSALAEHAANRDTLAVDIQRTHHINDDDQTEVENENIAQAYRYGKTLVPMVKEDKKAMQLETTKGCKVLGFTSKDNVPRHLYTRDVCHIFAPQPDDQHAAVAFSSLCHALIEKNMVAIVRYVTRANTDPKIGFLTPHIKSSYEGLLFIALPYSEDIRSYFFPRLEGGKENKILTDDQNNAVDSMIDDMMLVKEIENDDGETEQEELLKPSKILNPVNQRQCQCIQYRALNPEETTLPDVEEYIMRTLTVIPEISQRCEGSLKRVRENFPLEEVASKKTAAVDMFKKDGESHKAEDDKASTEEFSLKNLTKKQVTEVGLTDPVEDFKVLTENASNDRVIAVHGEMSQIVLRLVQDSFLNQHYEKALKCIRELRAHCVTIGMCLKFNELLLLLKDACAGKRRQDFWDLLVTEKVYPINKQEATDSVYSEVQAKNFYEEKEDGKTEEIPQENAEEDADDLLDML